MTHEAKSHLAAAVDAYLARLAEPPSGQNRLATPSQAEVLAEITADLERIAVERAASASAKAEHEAQRQAALRRPSPPGTTERAARLLAEGAARGPTPTAPQAPPKPSPPSRMPSPPSPRAGAVTPPAPVCAGVSPARQGLSAIIAAATGRELQNDAEVEAAFTSVKAASANAEPPLIVVGNSSLLAAYAAGFFS